MTPRRRIAVVVLAASLAAAGLLYAASWTGSWRQEPGSVPVETLSLDVDRFGLAPALYWLPDPDRLVLVPAARVPWTAEAVAADGDGEVLVVDLGSGGRGWRRSAEVFDPRARHVFWGLPQQVEGHPGEEVLRPGRSAVGSVATLTFGGIGYPVPAYNANVPPFGEPGWRLQRRRFGRWRLAAGDEALGGDALELTRLTFNSSHEMELSSLAAWLPGGRFLVVSPRTGERTLLLAGPFPSAAPEEGR